MQSWGLTDPGCVRKQNQDAYRIEQLDHNTLLCVVCDGMGGAKSGNVASTLAVDVFAEEISSSWTPGMSSERIDQMLLGAVKLANFTVYDQAAQFEEFSGMGTTLVAALIQDDMATLVNVGDSRAYGINRSGIRLLTKDHSLVQLMVDRGDLTPEVAKSYPGKNFITRAIGTERSIEADIFSVDLSNIADDACALLCSDGLSAYVETEQIRTLLTDAIGASVYDGEATAARMIDAANEAGGPDNITVVLIRFAESVTEEGDNTHGNGVV